MKKFSVRNVITVVVGIALTVAPLAFTPAGASIATIKIS